MRSIRWIRAAAPVALLCCLGLLAAGCSDDEPADPDRVVLTPAKDGATHTHDRFIGDGTTAGSGGYRMTDLTFPQRSQVVGEVSFVLRDAQRRPITDYVEDQTKELHLYVVRDDLSDFRHLHPVLGDDGVWRAPVDLAGPGRYRVVAEFVPAAEPTGAHVVLGSEAVIPGTAAPAPDDEELSAVGTDGLVTVEFPESLPAGVDKGFDVTVSDGDRGVLNLGSYLGTYAHVTGFEEASGAFVHAHPIGTPETTSEGSELRFHTSFEVPGRYRFFVQVRVDGFVHTVEVAGTVD